MLGWRLSWSVRASIRRPLTPDTQRAWMTDEPLLDIKQAALFLNVSETSLRRWTNDGRLACLRVGGRHERRFRRSDLVAFLEQPARALVAVSSSGSASTAETDEETQGSHVCGLYGTDGDRIGIAITFVQKKASRRAACYVLADADVRAAIVARLRLGETARAAWRDWIVPCEAAPSVEEQYRSLEDQLSTTQHAGLDSTLLICDMWELATRFGMVGLMAYEAGYSERIAKRFGVSTLCLYDVRRFSGTDLLDGLRRHRDMFRYPDAPVGA
jgi:excisionase family DNA binding protein